MPYVTTDDDVRLWYEETGRGAPVVFVHEFAGDSRSWEGQLRHFGRRYRCIAFNARGYPPSDVPESLDSYSQARACADIRAVLDGLNIDKAHVVGLSMGGFATLHFGFTHAERARSLVVAGCGYGAEPGRHAGFAQEALAAAAGFEAKGMSVAALAYGLGPTRVQFQNTDPRGWQEFVDQLGEHSTDGAVRTMRGVQARRPSLYDLTDSMRALVVPTLVITGDEDWPCLAPGLLMKQMIPSAGLVVMPNAGHAINLEDPGEFNRQLDAFFHSVECGTWPMRDPRAAQGSILGADATDH